MANNTTKTTVPLTRNEEPMDNTVVTLKTPFGIKSTWAPTQKQSNERPVPYNDPFTSVVGDIITFPLFGVKAVAEQGVKETAKQATKQAAKSAVKAVPALGGWSFNRGINWARKKWFNKQNSSTIKRPISPEEKAGIPKHERKTKSPYQQIGIAIEPKSRKEHITVDSPIFGDYIDRGGQQSVFNVANNPEQVLKVYTDKKFTSIPEIREFHKQWMKRNKLPIQERIKFQGYLQGKDRIYPVYGQKKINVLGDVLPYEWTKVYLPQINKEMHKLGYKGNGTYTNGVLTVGDISPFNVGYDNGKVRFIDADIYKKGGKLLFQWT